MAGHINFAPGCIVRPVVGHCPSNNSKFYCLRQCTSKRGGHSANESLSQASSQSSRNTQFGFFVRGSRGPTQWGDLSPHDKQWPNGNATDRSLYGPQFEPRSGKSGAAAAADRRPTRIRTAGQKVCVSCVTIRPAVPCYTTPHSYPPPPCVRRYPRTLERTYPKRRFPQPSPPLPAITIAITIQATRNKTSRHGHGNHKMTRKLPVWDACPALLSGGLCVPLFLARPFDVEELHMLHRGHWNGLPSRMRGCRLGCDVGQRRCPRPPLPPAYCSRARTVQEEGGGQGLPSSVCHAPQPNWTR